MLFDLLDRVEVNGKIGVINRIDTIESNVYYFESGQAIKSIKFAYYLLGDDKPYSSNDLKTNVKQFIDRP